jgi:hypothetical protein
MNNTTRQVGGALGIAVLGAVMNARYLSEIEHSHVLAYVSGGTEEAVRSSIQGAHAVAAGFTTDVSQVIIGDSSEAFTQGMNEAMLIGGIIMTVAALLTLIILPMRVQPPVEASSEENSGKAVM